MSSVADKPIRSVVKALSWRTTGTIDTFLVSFLITRTLTVALSIGLFEIITKTVLYYFHERAWNKINFGKNEIEKPEYYI
jgi:uncharacterized membrane protein